MRKLREMI